MHPQSFNQYILANIKNKILTNYKYLRKNSGNSLLGKVAKSSIVSYKKSTVSIINYISKRTKEGGSMINNLLCFYHTRKNVEKNKSNNTIQKR